MYQVLRRLLCLYNEAGPDLGLVALDQQFETGNPGSERGHEQGHCRNRPGADG
jgi:hypothetical protein